MNGDLNRMIDAYLDDMLDDEGMRSLEAWIEADPEHAREFAKAVLLHDRLSDRMRALESRSESESRRSRPLARRLARGAVGFGAAAAVLLGLFLVMRGGGGTPVNAAEQALERMIVAEATLGDRTYRIRAIGPEQRPPVVDGKGRGRGLVSIDGALLTVGRGGRYVLVRLPGEPGQHVTGSDGKRSWSVPPVGAVRVSEDVSRFRGALPGEQQDLPFVELRNGLGRLREAYLLNLEAGRRPGTKVLTARKRSAEFRGPRAVAIEFDEASGVVRSMRMDGLPQARGGPRSLSIDLVEQREVGADYFDHRTHHVADRKVVYEASDGEETAP